MYKLSFRHLLASAALGCGLLFASTASAQTLTEPTAVQAPADPQLMLQAEGTGTEALPTATISLLDLRVRRLAPDAPGVVLYWTSSSEADTAGFVIERQYEGEVGFRRVALVPSHTSSLPSSYSFVDAYNSSARPSTYRLRRLSLAGAPSLVSVPQLVPGALPSPPTPAETSETAVAVAAP